MGSPSAAAAAARAPVVVGSATAAAERALWLLNLASTELRSAGSACTETQAVEAARLRGLLALLRLFFCEGGTTGRAGISFMQKGKKEITKGILTCTMYGDRNCSPNRPRHLASKGSTKHGC